jgi:hypothetical protein
MAMAPIHLSMNSEWAERERERERERSNTNPLQLGANARVKQE